MSKSGTGRAVLMLSIFGIVVAAIILAYQLCHHDKAVDEWPVSLHTPLFLPTQAGFASATENNHGSKAADEAWIRALSGFRSASSDNAAVKQTAPLLRDIWDTWPDSDAAIRAQLFYLGTLETYGADEIGLDQSLEFIERAFQSPQLYFSSEHQASAQSVAADLIQTLIEENNKTQAWRLCVRLRWLMPRVDLLTPVCQNLVKESLDLALTPKLTLSLLSPLVPVSKIPTEKLTPPLAAAVQHYLSHPYDVDALAKIIIALYKEGFNEISSKLLLELLQINPMAVPKVEVAIDKLMNTKK